MVNFYYFFTFYNVQCKVYSIYYIFYNIQYTVYNIHCKLYSVCTVYNVHSSHLHCQYTHCIPALPSLTITLSHSFTPTLTLSHFHTPYTFTHPLPHSQYHTSTHLTLPHYNYHTLRHLIPLHY